MNLQRSLRHLQLIGSLTAAWMATGCSPGIKAAFRPTDPSFQPSPAAEDPRVYLYRDDLPEVAMRSIGMIEVSAPGSEGMDGAVRAAVAKGKQVGCWALVEHSVFLWHEQDQREEQQRSGAPALPYRPGMLLAHGGGGHENEPMPERSVTPAVSMEFDCVLRVDEDPPGVR